MPLPFRGQDECALDANGRIKLNAAFLRDFKAFTSDEVVLHCLPEGAIAIYPPQNWGRGEDASQTTAAESVVERRRSRRFGAVSQSGTISNQGRITLPTRFRAYAGLIPGETVVLVGCENGIEVWNSERWQAEFELIQEHMLEKHAFEMNTDLGERAEL